MLPVGGEVWRRGQGISYLPLFPYMWAEGARRSASRMLGLCSLAEGKVPFKAHQAFLKHWSPGAISVVSAVWLCAGHLPL